MDLRTAIAASMLPTTRLAVAAAFKDLHQGNGGGAGFLEFLWSAAGRADPLDTSTINRLLDEAALAIEAGRAQAIEPIGLFDAAYPALLATIRDPPPVVWMRGDRTCLEGPAVAIVGSRAATPYALQVGARLGAELAERGLLVVSGLARGVDSAAHRGCLDAGGRTAAVLGSGVDRVYPSEHANLAERIAATGLVMAELAPGAAPLPEHFPLRNRIISGISLAAVVVEASEQSGSLITARFATEQGRDVMAVPGSVLSGRNRGSHALLKDGAAVVESADDILQALGWRRSHPRDDDNLLMAEPLLAQMAPGEAYGLEDLSAVTGEEGARLLPRLAQLELAGQVESIGGRFVRRRR